MPLLDRQPEGAHPIVHTTAPHTPPTEQQAPPQEQRTQLSQPTLPGMEETKQVSDETRAKLSRARQKYVTQKRILTKYLEAQQNLPSDVQAILEEWRTAPKRKSKYATALFMRIFGDDPQVGDSRTLHEVFTLTYKGVDNMKTSIKAWAKLGVIVEYIQNDKAMLESTYVIRQLEHP